jgi:hypothetical protein
MGDKLLSRSVLICLTLLPALLADGIHPRGRATDYPAHSTAQGVTLAAAVIPPDEVKKLFAGDLNRGGYVVVEVAIYPEGINDLEIAPIDFLLKIGESNTVRAVRGRAIAAVLDEKNAKYDRRGSPVGITDVSSTIGIESGGGYDPVTGQRRPGGVYTGTGVGVGAGSGPGVGGGSRGPYPPDRGVMEQELEDRALPEGKITHAVAGYLYFPKPEGKLKKAPYEITFSALDTKIRVVAPPPGK